MCEPLIQGDCRTEGSGENGKGRELAPSGSGGAGRGPVETFSTVYPFPQGVAFHSRGARMGALDGSMCLGHSSNISKFIS